MGRARSMSVLLALAGCGPEVLLRDVSPGDLVVLVEGLEDPSSARAKVAQVGAGGAASLERSAEVTFAIAVVRASDVVDETGAPASLEDVGADLLGDALGECGCQAPSLGGRLIAHAGDRCALPAAAELSGDAPVPVWARDRLRLRFPGACACVARAPVESSQLDVCPIGDGAERLQPAETAIASDGAVIVVERGRAVSVLSDGTRFESPISPALTAIVHAIPTPEGGAFLVGAPPVDGATREFGYVSPRGAGAFLLATRPPPEMGALALVDSRSGAVWTYGAKPGAGRVNAALARCDFSEVDAVRCVEPEFEMGTACPQNIGLDAISALVELGDGRIFGAFSRGPSFILDGDRVRCVPGGARMALRGLDGVELPAGDVASAAAVGQRVVACVESLSAEGAVALVVTTTVGDTIGPWVTVAERVGRGASCVRPAFTDLDDRAVVAVGVGVPAQVRFIVGTATGAAEAPHPFLYAELDGRPVSVARSSDALAITTIHGETWLRRRGEARLERLMGLGRPPSGAARAILSTDDGFRVFTGAPTPLEVRRPTGRGCEGAQRASQPDSYTAGPTDVDSAVVRLGEETLVFGARAGEPGVRVLDASGALARTLPLGGARYDPDDPTTLPVVAAAALSSGRVALFLRGDGALWSTDGRSLALIDDQREWTHLAARAGVAWVGGGPHLGRVVLGPAGAPVLDADVADRVERAEFEALPRTRDPELSALAIRCDGGLWLGYREAWRGDPTRVGAQTSAWILRPSADRWALELIDLSRSLEARPLGSQKVLGAFGADHAPLFLYGGDSRADGLFLEGTTRTALPFLRAEGWASDGADVLFGGSELRLALARIRADAP